MHIFQQNAPYTNAFLRQAVFTFLIFLVLMASFLPSFASHSENEKQTGFSNPDPLLSIRDKEFYRQLKAAFSITIEDKNSISYISDFLKHIKNTDLEFYFNEKLILSRIFQKKLPANEYGRNNESLSKDFRLHIPYENPVTAVEIKQKNASDSPTISNLPFSPDALACFASRMLHENRLSIAREAIERIKILNEEKWLNNDPGLFTLKSTTPRPSPESVFSDQSSNVSNSTIFLFHPIEDNEKILFKVYKKISFVKSEGMFSSESASFSADIAHFLFENASQGTPTSYAPTFSQDSCFMINLSNSNGKFCAIIGEIEKNKAFRSIYAINENKFLVFDNPVIYWAVNLLIAEARLTESSLRENETQGLPTAILDLGMKNSGDSQIKQSFIENSKLHTVLPDSNNDAFFSFISWPQILMDDVECEFNSAVNRNELEKIALSLKEESKIKGEIFLKQLTSLIKEKPVSCYFSELQCNETYLDKCENRWLKAMALNVGLPVGNELRRLLRLYKIIGAPLPDRISLRMPLLFRANFVNPRRPEGEHDMISGYWFDELGLLVIADFDTDAASTLGRFAAESIGLKGELAAENSRIVLYDGFNFKNHGLRLAIPADHKAGAIIATELEKHQIKPADDSMMLENPDAYRFFASISDRVFFILSEKDKPLQMRFEAEPER